MRTQESTSREQNDEASLAAEKALCLKVPVVGYEILEERPKHTVFKLKVENAARDNEWIVFRRYTDFLRLHKQIHYAFPDSCIDLPPKRYFGDNFDPLFLEERAQQLNSYLNQILQIKSITESEPVRRFFGIGNKPSPQENLEECRARCEILEDKVFQLQEIIRKKDLEMDVLRAKYQLLRAQNDLLLKLFRNGKENRDIFAAIQNHVAPSQRSSGQGLCRSHSLTDCTRCSAVAFGEDLRREPRNRRSPRSSNSSMNYKFRRSFMSDAEVIRESGEYGEPCRSGSTSPVADSAISSCDSNNCTL